MLIYLERDHILWLATLFLKRLTLFEKTQCTSRATHISIGNKRCSALNPTHSQLVGSGGGGCMIVSTRGPTGRGRRAAHGRTMGWLRAPEHSDRGHHGQHENGRDYHIYDAAPYFGQPFVTIFRQGIIERVWEGIAISRENLFKTHPCHKLPRKTCA